VNTNTQGATERTFFASFNRFEIEMPAECVTDCSHQGQCSGDVEHWHSKGAVDFSHITDSDLQAELREYGAWEPEELEDRDDNEQRILWIGAGDIQESEEWAAYLQEDDSE
jgi:hypothetical protein